MIIFLHKSGGKKLKDFVATFETSDSIQSEIKKIRLEVEEFAKQFPTIGFEKETMKYKIWWNEMILFSKVWTLNTCVSYLIFPNNHRPKIILEKISRWGLRKEKPIKKCS